MQDRRWNGIFTTTESALEQYLPCNRTLNIAESLLQRYPHNSTVVATWGFLVATVSGTTSQQCKFWWTAISVQIIARGGGCPIQQESYWEVDSYKQLVLRNVRGMYGSNNTGA